MNFPALRRQVLIASQRIFQEGVGWVCVGRGFLAKMQAVLSAVRGGGLAGGTF